MKSLPLESVGTPSICRKVWDDLRVGGTCRRAHPVFRHGQHLAFHARLPVFQPRNPDSTAPVLERMEADIRRIMESLEWS